MGINPIYNALAAAAYIVVVGSFMYYANELFGPIDPEGPIAPITMLSLLTFSVALMAYFFFYNPAKLYVAGRGQDGIAFFTKTLAAFAGITVFFLAILFFVS